MVTNGHANYLAMWLINVDTYKLELFVKDNVWEDNPYAILSHVWEHDEVSFQDIQDLDYARSKAGFWKIRKTCQQAKIDGLSYAWVDTCCIDKSSSAELQEAINSMFRWYGRARCCYVYLADLIINPTIANYMWLEQFTASRWFTRGWTLQELIAPHLVRFYNMSWECAGSRGELKHTIASRTGIDSAFLEDYPLPGFQNASPLRYPRECRRGLSHFSVAMRMSWAAARWTTRTEDRAYSLLGLFGISMPLLYGEGPKAFARLQEEILRTSPDPSVVLWEYCAADTWSFNSNLLAPSPDNFYLCRSLHFQHNGMSTNAAAGRVFSSIGMRASMLFVESPDSAVLMDCYDATDLTRVIALNVTGNYKDWESSLAASREVPLLLTVSALTHHDQVLGIRRTRTRKIDVLEAESKSTLRDIVLLRDDPRASDHIDHPPYALLSLEPMKGSKVLQVKDGGRQHVWLRLTHSTAEPPWYASGVYPQEGWDTSRLTCNMTEYFHNDLYMQNTFGRIPFLLGSVALQKADIDCSLIAVSFACLVNWVPGIPGRPIYLSSYKDMYFRLDRIDPKSETLNAGTLRSFCQKLISETIPAELDARQDEEFKGLCLRERTPVQHGAALAVRQTFRVIGMTRFAILEAFDLSSLDEMETLRSDRPK